MKKTAIFLMVLTLLPIGLKAQVKTYGYTAGGLFLTKGATTNFAMEAGAKTSLWTDSTSGFSSFNKTGYFYVDGEGTKDIQSASSWLMAAKRLTFGSVKTYVALGAGMIYEIEDAGDSPGGAFALELGATIIGDLSVYASLQHQPVKDQPDESALLVGIDLFP